MAKFSDDFSSSTVGNAPTGWTARVLSGTFAQDWQVLSDAGATGGKVLRYNAGGGGNAVRQIAWDAPGQNADVNILIKMKRTEDQFSVWPVGRASDSADTLYGAFKARPTADLQINKRVTGTQSNVNTGTATFIGSNATGYIFIRLDISGGAQKAKAWLSGNTEPAAYQVSATDTDITAAGDIGLWAFDANQVDIDWISAGTGGDVADNLDVVAVTSLDTIPATAYPGETITLGVTGAEAIQGTGGVTINGETQTISSWSDTSIDITVVQGDTPYGKGNTVTLTTDGGDTDTGTIELVADTASGFGYVVMSSPNTSDESSVAFGATPTVVNPDQFEWEDFNDLAALSDPAVPLEIDAEGFVVAVGGEGTFRGRFWDATDSTWGAVGTFTAEVPGTYPFSKGIKYAANQNWEWGNRHPMTSMRVRIYK